MENPPAPAPSAGVIKTFECDSEIYPGTVLKIHYDFLEELHKTDKYTVYAYGTPFLPLTNSFLLALALRPFFSEASQ